MQLNRRSRSRSRLVVFAAAVVFVLVATAVTSGMLAIEFAAGILTGYAAARLAIEFAAGILAGYPAARLEDGSVNVIITVRREMEWPYVTVPELENRVFPVREGKPFMFGSNPDQRIIAVYLVPDGVTDPGDVFPAVRPQQEEEAGGG